MTKTQPPRGPRPFSKPGAPRPAGPARGGKPGSARSAGKPAVQKPRAERPAEAPRPRNVRALAAQALLPVFEGKESLSSSLPPLLAACRPADRGLLQSLAMGTVRHAIYYRALLKPLLSSPPQPLVGGLLLLGLHQILAMRVPDHAAISETVEAARQLGLDKLTGFVNGVLRNFLRDQAALEAQAQPLRHAHPAWLLARLQADWPEQAAAIVAANNEPGPLTLRVNRQRRQRAGYLGALEAAGIEAQPCAYSTDGLSLAEALDVTTLPGWADGQVSVQDEAAQLAAGLLGLAPGQRVLDACAAPGGKTAHILEAQPGLAELLALDVDPERCARIRETLERLRLGGPTVKVLTADAAQPGPWSQGAPFDRILLDAPCTATGVIRRHPDIKLLRRDDDVAQTVALQAALLDQLWSCLAPGGRLLYATCSLFKAENEANMAAFLARTPDARELPLDVSWGEARPHGRQLLPQAGGHDGFYYCLLAKPA